MTIFTLGSLTIVSAAQGGITIQVPNYNETLTNTQAQALANAIARTLTTAHGDGGSGVGYTLRFFTDGAGGSSLGDIFIGPYPTYVSPQPWPGVTLVVKAASPVVTINMTQDQAQTLAAALNLYTVTYQ
jgi:hypothetical protein